MKNQYDQMKQVKIKDERFSIIPSIRDDYFVLTFQQGHVLDPLRKNKEEDPDAFEMLFETGESMVAFHSLIKNITDEMFEGHDLSHIAGEIRNVLYQAE